MQGRQQRSQQETQGSEFADGGQDQVGVLTAVPRVDVASHPLLQPHAEPQWRPRSSEQLLPAPTGELLRFALRAIQQLCSRRCAAGVRLLQPDEAIELLPGCTVKIRTMPRVRQLARPASRCHEGGPACSMTARSPMPAPSPPTCTYAFLRKFNSFAGMPSVRASRSNSRISLHHRQMARLRGWRKDVRGAGSGN